MRLNDTRPTYYVLENGTVVPKYDDVNPEMYDLTVKTRRPLCDSCENKIPHHDTYACQLCGCRIERLTTVPMPLDSDGKAIKQIINGKNIYACNIKKW